MYNVYYISFIRPYKNNVITVYNYNIKNNINNSSEVSVSACLFTRGLSPPVTPGLPQIQIH